MDVWKTSLESTRKTFLSRLKRALVGKSTIDEDLLDNIEEVLISSDIDLKTTLKIIEHLSAKAQRNHYTSEQEITQWLREVLIRLLSLPETTAHTPFTLATSQSKPYVVLMVGVNGVGKTTSLAKIAYAYKQRGYQVLLGAADTFRAAAVSQLRSWGKKMDLPVVFKEGQADPSSVAFETLTQAKKSRRDIALIDTAGRLHNQEHLMQELSKIRRTLTKQIPQAPHEVLLVLDASTGQNAFKQAKVFKEATQLTGLVLSKLDGSAKGGVLIGIVNSMQIPVRYVGTGEKPQDLHPFHPQHYVNNLLSAT